MTVFGRATLMTGLVTIVAAQVIAAQTPAVRLVELTGNDLMKYSVTAIAAKPGSSTARLRELLMTVHFMNKERFVGDSKLHEMVAIAMEEDWKVCDAHLELLVTIVGKVVAEGMASGEFKAADPMTAALCVFSAMVRFFHPQIIAQCATKPGPTLEQMVDFVIGSISATKA